MYFFSFLSERNIGSFCGWSRSLEINKQTREENRNIKDNKSIFILLPMSSLFFFAFLSTVLYLIPLLCGCLGVLCPFGALLLLLPPLTVSDVGDVGPLPELSPLLFDDDG